MADIIKITDFSAPELDVYVRLTGAQLRQSREAELGIFIAESPTVIEVALECGCEPISVLTEERLLSGSVKKIIELCGNIPVYTADRELLTRLTGFELTRGALCAMKRPPLPALDEVLSGATRIAVLEEIADSTNVGAIFRSAAALGVDAVLLTPTSCDPLCRRAVRVSMGTVFKQPWTRICESGDEWLKCGVDILKSYGFTTCAMALSDSSVSLDDEALMQKEKLALILGTEGTGLKKETIERCDYTVRIPMQRGVDSLNVATAGAIAFWHFRKR